MKTFLVLFLAFLVFAYNPCFGQDQQSGIVVEEVPTVIQEQAPTDVANNQIILDTLELRDMDINDVLKLISLKSGLNIIAGKNIQGRVTIYLKNVEVHDALSIILKANDLAYVEDRGVIQIIPESKYEQLYGIKFGRRTEGKIYSLQSMKAADAVALLNQIKSSIGKVVADDQSNTLMIEDTPEKLSYMIDYLKTVDIPSQWQTFVLKYVPVEGVVNKITEQVNPKIGIIKFDVSSNKIFIKDTPAKLVDLKKLIDQMDVPRETKVFKISYSKAEDVIKTLTPLLTKDIGTVQADLRSNQVIVTDIAPKLIEIKTVIDSIDKKEREVLIDAKIVQINLSDEFHMGIDWNAIVKKYTSLDADGNRNGLTFDNNFSLPGSVAAAPMGKVTVGAMDSGGYNAIINAISSISKVKILSNPHIAVLNNQEAKILVGSNQPYATSTTTTPSTGSPVTATNVNFIDVGVKLRVTPTIHEDGYITMKIHPEVSSSTEDYKTTDSTGNSNTIPIVETSEVDTMVRVKDGVTIIIGGLIKDEVSNNQNKVPILGDIPLIGKAFRNDQRTVSKTETVVFLTPHIITGDIAVNPDEYPLPKIKKNKTYYSPIHAEK